MGGDARVGRGRARPGTTKLGGLGVLVFAAVGLGACGTTVPQTSTITGGFVNATGSATASSVSGEGSSGTHVDAIGPAVSGATTTSAAGGNATGAASGSAAANGSSAANGSATTTAGSDVQSTDNTAAAGGATNRKGTGSGKPKPGVKPTDAKNGSAPAAGGTKAGGTTAGDNSGVAATSNGPGVSATSITVGFVYVENAAAEQAALGNTIDEGDPLGNAKAVVTYLNAHAGLGGRSINLQPYGIDATSNDSTDVRDAAICAKYTSDIKTFAVLNVLDVATATCLAKSGVEPISDVISTNGANDFASVPTFLDTEDETPQDDMPNLVDALAKDGYLTTKWDTSAGAPGGALPVKIGIVYPNEPYWEDAVNNQLLPALKARGINVDPADIEEYQFPSSNSDDGTAVADIQSAVLKFRSDNVTDVIPVEVNALAFFAIGASSQKYRPRYALNSADEAQITLSGGSLPAGQLAGAIGFGWNPLLDLSDASAYPSPAQPQCVKIVTDAGNTVSGNAAILVAATTCDQFFLLQRAIADLKANPVTATAVTADVGTFGSSFSFAALPAGTFSPTKHFPVATGYAYSYNSTCSCLAYTGAPYALR